jgi:gliding motility-associated-like protein
MKRIITSILILLAAYSNVKAQMLTNACESSPCNAISICGIGAKNQLYSFTSTGYPQSTCGAQLMSNNWVYYRFTCYASGVLQFQINPNDPLTDINWALYNITTSGCSNLAATTDCSAAASAGSVSSPAINITVGNTYILGVSRASGGATITGFNITFTGTTANLSDNVAPTMTTVLPFDTCLPVTTLKVKMSDPVNCFQIGANDFQISTNPTFTVAGSTCNGCVNATNPITNFSNYEDTLVFTFPTALAPGTYTISFNAASTNLPRDYCQNLPNTIPNVVVTIPTPLDLNVKTGFNCTTQTYLDTLQGLNGIPPYQYKVKGGSFSNTYGTATASYNIFTGLQGGVTYTLYVRGSNGCEDSVVTTHMAIIPLQAPNLSASASPPCFNQFNLDSISVAPMFSGFGPYTFSIAYLPASVVIGTSDTINGKWKNISFATGASFTVTVKDGLGCTKTAVKNLVNPQQLVLPNPTSTNPLCFGDSSGTISVIANGGTGPWTYVYAPSFVPPMLFANSSPSHIGNQVSNVPAISPTAYTVIVTDANGCTASATKVLSSNPIINVKNTNTPNPVTFWNPTCNSVCSGKIKPYATGGVGTKKDFTLFDVWPGTAIDSVKYIGITTVVDSFFDNLCAGTYTVVAKDQAGCTASTVFTLSLPAYPVLALDSTVNVLCNGGCNGRIYTTTSGATGPFTYTITPSSQGSCTATSIGANTGDYNGLWANNNYTIIVTKAYGADQCKDTIENIIITEPTALAFNAPAVTNILCFGDNTGDITMTATGGTGQISYTINPLGPQSNTTGTFLNLTAQCYTITATDANGCTLTSSVCLTQPTDLTLAVSSIVNASCFGLCDGTASAAAGGGAGGFQYYITAPGVIDINTGAITALCAGAYTVTVEDANNCDETVVINITQPNQLTAASVVNQNALCNGDCNGSATITPAGGTQPYTYAIAGPGTPNITTPGATASATNLCAGTYTITITDANTCSTTITVVITQPAVLTAAAALVNNPTCANACNGVASITPSGGTAPFNYTIAGNAIGTPAITTPGATATATALCADTYTITVTDGNGCTASTTITIVDPSAVTIGVTSIANALCFQSCNGSATMNANGGNNVFSYSINPTTNGTCNVTQAGNVFSGLWAGSYTVTVQDGNACSSSTVISITEPNQLIIDTVSVSDVSCNSGCDGVVTMNFVGGTPGVTYAISPNVPCVAAQAVPGTFTNLGANLYLVTGTDANGCTATRNVLVTQPNVLTLSITGGTNPTCTPGCDGTAQATAGGGTTAYNYTISPSGTINAATGAMSNLCAGTNYVVTVTDAEGCSTTAAITMSTPGGPVVSINTFALPSCNPGCDGSIAVTWTGGTSPYTVAINGTATATLTGPTAASGLNLCAGTNYTLTVTDDNSCVGIADTVLNSPNPPAVNVVSTTNVTCSGLCTGVVNLSSVGGTGLVTFGNLVWANAAMTCVPAQTVAGTYTGLGANTYTVTGTDAAGCTGTVSFTITEPNTLSIAVTASANPLCFSACDGTINFTGAGGTPILNYSISPSTNGTCNAALAGNQFSSLWGTTTYTLTVTDANGCTATTTQQLTQPNQLIIDTVSVSDVSCNSGCDGVVTMNFVGGTPGVTYAISPNVPCVAAQAVSGTFTNLGANLYLVTGTDANGCTATRNVLVTQPNVLTLSITGGINPSCTPGCDGTAQATAGGGTTAYNYTISPSGTINAATGAMSNLCAGTNYVVTVTDAEGCSTTAAITMSTPGGPVVSINTFALPSCNPGCDGSIAVTWTGGTSPYIVSINGTATATLTGPTAASGLNLCAGTNYTLTVTDDNSCVGIADTVLNSPNPPAVNVVSTTNVTCNGLCTGVVNLSSVGGTGAVTFGNLVWANAAMTCVPTQTVAGTFTGLGANTYTVTGTDALGCTGTVSFTITEPAALSLVINAYENPLCFGDCNGSINFTGAGGTPIISYTISPSTNGTCNAVLVGNDFTNLWGTTTYIITMTDANGCTRTASQQLIQPSLFSIDTLSKTNVSCNGGCDGQINMTFSGGTGPVTYSISPANVPCPIGQVVSGVFTNVGANAYVITGTDANGCVATRNVAITQPAALTVGYTPGNNPTCNPGCDGTGQANPGGGTPGYSYTISGGATISGGGAVSLVCGSVSYTITVTDAKGCTATTSFTMTTPGGPTINSVAFTTPTCSPGCDGTATFLGTGNAPPYSYQITGGAVIAPAVPSPALNPAASVLCANTTYTITIQDANLCTATTTLNLAPPVPPIIDSLSTTPVSCTPGCDGSITMTPVGLTYTVSGAGVPTVAGNVISNLCANSGAYTIIGTNALNCKDTFLYIPLAPLGVPITGVVTTPPSCNPGCDGEATLTPANLGYAISPAGPVVVGNFITGICATTIYTITSTDANNCTNSSTIQLFPPNLPPQPALTAVCASAFGVSNGSITVTNVLAGSIYTINPALVGPTPIGQFNALPGDSSCTTVSGFSNYTITVTDANGCSATSSTCVCEPTPSLCNYSQTNVTCFGGNNGSFDMNSNGGAGGWTFTSNPATNIDVNTGIATNLTAGPYTVIATDANLNTCSSVITITQPPVLGFNAPFVVPTACTTACSGTIVITATGGTPTYTYTILAPANGCTPLQSTTTPGSFTSISTGTYTIEATDANGCTASTTVVVNPPAPPTINSTLITDVTCFGACNGQIIINATGATFYSINGGSNYQASTTFNAVCAGTYTVQVIGANGCTATSVVVVNEPTALVIDSVVTTAATCAGPGNNGTITVYASGGNGIYQYTTNPPIYQASNLFTLAPATYTITVQDALGCTVTAVTTITSPPAISWLASLHSDLNCNGDSSGSITAIAQGGTGTLEYALNPGFPTFSTVNSFTNLPAGLFTVTVKDANNCTLTTNITVNEPAALVFSAPTVVDNICFGTSAGSISISASGGVPGYTYSIAPTLGINPAPGFFDQLPAGNYVITVVDTTGCSEQTAQITVNTPPQIILNVASQINIECNGAATGGLDINGSGGTGALTYTLQPGAITTNNGLYSGLTAGTYTIFVTDLNLCSASIVVTLTQPPAMQFIVIPTEPICSGDANGALNLQAQGGQPPYEYSLDGGPFQTSGIYTNLISKVYVLTVRDSKGCLHSENYLLTEPLPVSAVLNIRDAKCINSSDGRIQVIPSGGRGGYKFYVMPGLLFNKSGLFTNLKPGTYNLRVLDTANCEYNIDFTINPPAFPLTVNITKQDLGCTGKGYEGQATANVSGGEQPYTYLWFTNPVQTDAIADSLYYGWYSMQVADANGCIVKDSVYIEEGPCCDVSFIPNAFSPNGDGNNDVFRVLTTAGIELQQLEIYDRWGKKVWGTNNYRFGWDGTIEGKQADLGAYYYVLRYKCTRDQNNYTKKGDVLLVR